MTWSDLPKGRVYTFPLPPDELRPNRRMGGHWATTNRLKLNYKESCGWVIHEAGVPSSPIKHCRLTMTAYLGKRQRVDLPDLGSWGKAAIDAMVSMGVLVDDQASCVSEFTTRVDRDWQNPRLVVEVKE